MGIRGLLAIAGCIALLSTGALAQNGPPKPREPEGGWYHPMGGWFNQKPNISISIGANHISGDYAGLGSVSGTTGLACAETDFWSASLRYAGEFSGFRAAAFGSLCHNFEKVSAPVGAGIDGIININALLAAGVRLSVNIGFPDEQIGWAVRGPELFLEGGFAASHMKIEAFPFESATGWVNGVFIGFGVQVPLAGCPFGTGVAPNTNACAASVYLGYRHYENEGKRISGAGGSRIVDTSFDTIMVGLRINTEFQY